MNEYKATSVVAHLYQKLDRMPTQRLVNFHFQCWQDGDEEGMSIAETILYFREE